MPRLLLAALLAALTVGAVGAQAQGGAPDELGTTLGFSKAFAPNNIGPGSVSTLTFSITNFAASPHTGIGFTDTLPAGVTISTPSRATTDCSGGTLSAPDAGTTITFSDGGLGTSASCTVSVDVTSATAGTHTNVSGSITSTTETGGTASADLTVSPSLPGFSKSFAPSTVVQGGRSTLTFLIDNSANDSGVPNLDFTDQLPSGMVVASPANASTTCGTEVLPPTLTATAGSSTVTLDANGAIPPFGNFPAVAAGGACTVTVDVLATAVGALVNASGQLQANFVNVGFASAVLTSTSGGALALTKAFVTNPVAPGGTTTLRFTLRNNSRTEPATGVTFTDDLSGGSLTATGMPLTSVCGAGSTLTGSAGDTFLTLAGGALAPGETCVFEVAVIVDVPPDTSPYDFVSTTSAVSGTVAGGAVGGAPASATLFVRQFPVLTKEFTDDPVVAGGDVTLEFTISSLSPAHTFTDVAFQDELTTFLPTPLVVDGTGSDVCGAGSSLAIVTLGVSGQGLQLTGGTVPAEGSCTFSVTITLPDDLPAGTYTNTTSDITGTVGGETVIGLPASDDLVVVAGPQLTKAFLPASVQRGATTALQFTLSLDGNATADATGIGFTDNLSGVLSDLAPTAGQLPLAACGGTLRLQGAAGFGLGTVLEFVGGTLSPGDDCAFQVSLDVPASASYETFTNTTSTVSATVGGLAVTSPAASADLVVTPFRFEKVFVDMNVPGGSPRLVYRIRNLDPTHAATGMIFTDNLSAALSGMSASGTLPAEPCGPGSSLSGTTFLIMAGGQLPAGGTCAFAVPLVLPATPDAGTYSSVSSNLSAQVDGTTLTGPPASASFTLDSRLPQFTKAFAPETIFAGEVSRLTFTIDNAAQAVPAENITFTDALPDGVVVAPVPNASKTCTGGMLTDTPMGSSLVGGETTLAFDGGDAPALGACTISVDVTAAAEGSYLNTTSDLTTTIGNSGTASATLTVVDPLMYVTKAVTFETDIDNDGKADAGDVLHYTVTVTNRTGNALTGVTFNDTPGAHLTLVGGSVTAIPGTVTSGDQPTDTHVAVSLGTLESLGSATVVFDVTVDDTLPGTVGSVCNQGTVRNDLGSVLTDDPDTPQFNDPTCVATDQPALDIVITSHTGAARGESLQVFATAENTTNAKLHYRRRLFLTRPNGSRTSYPADRQQLGAGLRTDATLVTPAIPIDANAPAGTYIVEVVGIVLDPPVAVDTERFEFTLAPLVGTDALTDLSTVRPGAGPNPFLRRTTLRFPVLEATRVDLRVFDAAGREVAVLVEGQLPRGLHEAEFDGTSRPAGVYFWRLTVDGAVTTGAITLVR